MNTEVILEILNELQELKIIQETDGCYEVTHDILAGKVNERRITEDNNRLEATRLVYETEKNEGLLNEKQLNAIEPFVNRLAFADEDKERLTKYIKDCKQEIENDNAEKEAQLAKEKELRRRAQEKEKEANEARKDAIKSRNIARLFAIVGAMCACIAIFYKMKERLGRLNALVDAANSHIINRNFFSANKSTLDVKEILDEPFVKIVSRISKDPSIIKGKELESTLFPHLIFDHIKPSSDYILCSDNRYIIIKHPDNSAISDSKSFFKDSINNLSNLGFSSSTDNYWISESIKSIPNANAITLYTIISDSTGQKKPVSKVIDTVKVATGDFDINGNLYYIKNKAIWRYDIITGIKTPIHPLFEVNPFLKIKLSFLKKRNKAPQDQTPSDYFQISFGDSSDLYIINKNTFNCFSFPASSQLYLDSNRYLIYCYQLNKEWSPIYTFDLEKNTLIGKPFPSGAANLNLKNDFNKIGFALSKGDKNPPLIFSKDKEKSIQYDYLHSVLIVTHKKDTFKIKVTLNQNINAYEALDDMFVYVSEDKNGGQTVHFGNYSGDKGQDFKVLPAWKFTEFKERKYMVFGSIDTLTKSETGTQSLLILDPYMSRKDYLEKWFNKN